MIIVVMGISGCGKSTLGQSLAQKLCVPFEEGDEYHPSSNVAKMSKGIPLNDEDRQPWLNSLARHFAEWVAKGETRVVSCSALRKSYRDKFRDATDELCFLFLDGSADLIEERMKQRKDHFMPSSLIRSQVQTLEVPKDEPDVIRLDISLPQNALIQDAIFQLEAYPKV